jgi:hypothetical protein
MTDLSRERVESLGPAEQILATLLTHADHLYHGRPGMIVRDQTTPMGVRWYPVTHREQTVYRLEKVGKKTRRATAGTLQPDGRIVFGGQVVGHYRKPGLFPEAVVWLYGQIADVWKMDNEFAARWASWAFTQEHRDLKVALAAFMLVQSRFGEPVIEDGEVLFHDEDFREIGEAMCLLRRRDKRDLNPKLLLRVGDLLRLPGVVQINRELGFSRSARSPAIGRYNKAVTRWLRHRETNPKMLKGLVRAGFRRTVMQLARRVGYKPTSPMFFEILRWKQNQAADGRRAIAIGVDVAAAESWSGLSEREICERIVETRPSYKRLVGLLPPEIGLTRAIVAAAIETNCLSKSDLIILTPTLEDLGILEIPAFAARWKDATRSAEDQRAANIAARVRKTETATTLQEASDRALQKAVAKDLRGMRVYVGVDISASMDHSIEEAKGYLSQFLQGFPLDKLTVAVFNTKGREVQIRHPSAKGVTHAFRGFRAGGGTDHSAAIRDVFARHKPGPDEDAIMLWVGDQQQFGTFAHTIEASGINPLAFGMLHLGIRGSLRMVEDTAKRLKIPCFEVHKNMFGDAYAVGRTLRNLIASTPLGKRTTARKVARVSLVETILQTPLLTRPIWAA